MDQNLTFNRIASTDKVRIAGIEVKKPDADRWKTIMLSGGTDSGSVTYTLTKDRIDMLGRSGDIDWKTVDSKTEGNITIRPVFQYVDVEVEVRDNRFASLNTSVIVARDVEGAKDPTLLYDFSADWELMRFTGPARAVSDKEPDAVPEEVQIPAFRADNRMRDMEN